MFKFNNPEYFYLFFVLIVATIYRFSRRRYPSLRYSSIRPLKNSKPTLRTRVILLPDIIKLAAITLFIFALARPQSTSESSETITEGIDIVIALDISTSMLAQDFKPDRFRASLEVAKEFIKGRQNDRIGFVVFAGESYTQCPLTTDYNILYELSDKIKMGIIEDGTAIGTAIINSINRLKESKSKSKVIILLTDGENNKGEIEPETAAQAAEALGIRIYSIGIGKDRAPYPFKDMFGNTRLREIDFKIDEEMMVSIAETTGGKYFRAQDKEKLEKIYEEIDKLEKTKIKIKSYKRFNEKFEQFLLPGIILLLLSLVLENTYFAKKP
ncbi:MAG: VWA domain-containing protein [Candidatus Delongbacteria bacterium]|nr:VWA domain-containing protein [Candidatus Delongbacteria bacterium]